MQALLPLALPAVMHPGAAHDFLILTAAGHYALLPLLFQVSECAGAGSVYGRGWLQ